MQTNIENTVNRSDPGDDTLKRYRYQCAYAALISLGILKDGSTLDKIYCEHHEDVLVKLTNSKFVGIQVKTRNLNLGPLESTDDAVIKSIRRFVQLDISFPNQFQNFVIATNAGFAKKENAKGIGYVLSLIKNDTTITNGNVVKWIKKIAKEVSCTETEVKSVLKKTVLRPDIGSIDSIDGNLLKGLGELKLLDTATFAELKALTDKLVMLHINASSLAYKDPMHEYFILDKNPSDKEQKETIKGKSICKEDLLDLISQILTDDVKIHLKDDMPEVITGTKKLELKLDAGGISYDNLELLKANKASMEYKMASWRYKYNDKAATERYNQIKAIVHSECQSAFDEHIIVGGTNMTKPTPGTKMLIQLRKELKGRYSNDQKSFFDCIPEHLFGMAAILTEDCKVWWSEKFKLD